MGIKKTNLKNQNTIMRTFTLATLMSAALSIKMRACEDTNNNGICDEDEQLAQEENWCFEGIDVTTGKPCGDLAQEEVDDDEVQYVPCYNEGGYETSCDDLAEVSSG